MISMNTLPPVSPRDSRQERQTAGERGKSGKKGDIIHTDTDTLMMLSDSFFEPLNTLPVVFAGALPHAHMWTNTSLY